jgi:hypothetical protein
MMLAIGAAATWNRPCVEGRTCFHASLWLEMRAVAARCVVGRIEPDGRRWTIVDAPEPLETTLPQIPSETLAIDRLETGVVAVGGCASSACCVAALARPLRTILIDAHARALASAEDYRETPGIDERPFAEALLVAGVDVVAAYLATLDGNAHHIEWLLRNLSSAAAERPALRPYLRDMWPRLFDRVLALSARLMAQRGFGELALAALVPALRIPSDDWIAVDWLAQRFSAWAQAAAGSALCIDAAVQALRNTPTQFQVTEGLRLVRRMVIDFADIAMRTGEVLPWLQVLRPSVRLGDQGAVDFAAIVDGMVAGGDTRFVDEQRILDRSDG